MRTFSEEKRTGTIEVLLSAPVTEAQVVLGKFLGAWMPYCVLWGASAIFFVILRCYTALDWGPLFSGYLGTCLMGSVLIAVGLLASSLTRNQIIAFIVGFVLILGLFCVGFLNIFLTSPDSRKLVQYLSLIEHFQDFSKGIVDSRPVVFYLSLTVAMLFLTVRTVASPRWRT
jgi:ABC-2 type transport system permease protein